MAKRSNQAPRGEGPDEIREPVLDPTEEGGLAGAIATEETVGPVDAGATETKILRPSQVAAMMKEAGREGGDVFRYLREQGLPAPTRKIRVSGAGVLKGSQTTLDPREVEAVDESDAIRRYAVLSQLPASELHRFRFQTVILEE